MKSILLKMRYEGTYKFFFIILLMLGLFTFTYYWGAHYSVLEYRRAGMLFKADTYPEIQYYFGLQPHGRTVFSGLSVLENLLPEFIFPILIGVFFAGRYRNDRKGKVINLQTTRTGRLKYYLVDSIFITILIFGFFMMAILMQSIIGYGVLQFFNPLEAKTGIPLRLIVPIIHSATRISLYYSALLFFTYGVAVVMPFIEGAVYSIPLIFTIIPVFLVPWKVPLRQAFIENGSIFPFSGTYYITIGFFFLTGLLLIGMKVFIIKDEI